MISVIIPHLDQPTALRRCLASLALRRGVTQPVEIIVVDNGSTTLPSAICAEFAGVDLLTQSTPGPGPARNLGALRARGDILAFIDADCIAGESWLHEIEAAFARDSGLTILGGDVRIACQDRSRMTLLEAYESVFAYRMKEYIASQGFTGTGNLAVKARTFAMVGPFGGIDIAEDRDWGQRALRLGHRTYYRPGMIVSHPARKNFAELRKKWDRHVAHDFSMFQPTFAGRLRWFLRSLAVALSPVTEIPRILRSSRIRGARARMLALLGVVLIRQYRAGIMLTLAFGADASRLSESWNRPSHQASAAISSPKGADPNISP